jgi:hypothetical protein
MNDEPGGKSPSTAGIALGTIVSASAAPYGYTVSLWSSRALLIHFRGQPDAGESFLFAAGALIGFPPLGRRAGPALRVSEPIQGHAERVITGALHWFSVGAATAAVALIAQIPSWVAWPAGSLAATTLFLLCSGLQLAFVAGPGSIEGWGR